MKSVVIPIGKFAYYDPVIHVGFDKFPKHGEAAVCAFLHHNDFADLAMTIGALPRYGRFGAAAYLWKVPVLGCFPPALGAVPLARQGDSTGGGGSQEQSFNKLVDTLCDGGCLMLAPEGGSRMRTMVGELKKGWIHFAEQAVFKKTIEDQSPDASFTVSLVPVGVVCLQFGFWRSAVMVHCGDPIVIDAKKLRDAGISQGMPNDHAARKKFVNQIVEEFKPEMERVSMHIEPKLPQPDDNNKASILEGSFAALRLGVVAARIIWFSDQSQLPPIEMWCDSVAKLADLMNREDDLCKRVGKYHYELVFTGLRDSQVRSKAAAGGGQFCQFLCLSLLFLLLLPVFALALPGCIIWSPMFLLGCLGTISKYKKGLKKYTTPAEGSKERPDPRFRDGDVMRCRADFDTIPRIKGGPSFFYLPMLLIGLWICFSRYFLSSGLSLVKGIGFGFAAGFLAPLLLLGLAVRLLDEAFALLRAISGRWAMFKVKPSKLESLRQDRATLREIILSRGVVKLSDATSSGVNCLKGRCLRSDWMETISLNEDLNLTFCDYNDPAPMGVHDGYEALL